VSGNWRMFYENGKVKAECTYGDGVITKSWVCYDVNGKVTTEVTY